ncbi:hypothetical protein MY11210_002254 [Beauveria gryllotalpidicola]
MVRTTLSLLYPSGGWENSFGTFQTCYTALLDRSPSETLELLERILCLLLRLCILAHRLSYPHSLNLLLILNGVGIVDRIVPNCIADRIGAFSVFIPTSIIAINRPVGLYAWVAIYGVDGAGIQSLFPAVLAFLTTDLRKLDVRMGMAFTIVSFAMLTGPPIAGTFLANPDW